MPKERTVIDFDIIWKKINHSLSQEEEVLFSNWIDEDPSHQIYFENARQYYEKGFVYSDTEKVWKSIDKKLKQKNRRLKLISSLAVASVIILFFSLIPFSTKDGDLPESKPGVISPGSGHATLMLDDGSIIDLSSPKALQLAEGGSNIIIEDAGVKYSEKSSVDIQEIKYNTLKVPRGGEFFLELTDGSKVWLNSETTLRYPVQFSGNERKVELTGEAFFEVSKNEKAPFIVETEQQSLRVLGTKFNISSYKEDSNIYTTLVKGSVEVSLRDNHGTKLRLLPNEQSTTSKTNNVISKHKVDTYKYTAWKDGRFVFEDQTLEEIMTTLSRWYNVEVVFTRDELKNIRFTGNLQRYSNFDELINKIMKTNEVKFQVENRTITII